MRAVLLILILLVVVAIGAIATGLININQTQPARAPDVDANASGVTATGGQAPKFDVETGKIAVGTQDRQVRLPSIEVRPAGNDAGRNGVQPASDNTVATTNATQP